MLRIKPIEAIIRATEEKPLKRSLTAFHLLLLGVGAIVGSGIFVLTSEAAQKAGPGMIIAFAIAGSVCVLAALCYAEVASMIPASGSAYTYSYASLGEIFAWMVGWALILEYSVAASAVAVSWSGYLTGFLRSLFDIELPTALTSGPYAGGIINLPACFVALAITLALSLGTRKSARLNTIFVAIKLSAIAAFLALAIPAMQAENFTPFLPTGMIGVAGAAASIFFAFVGFDAVSTAAEETVNPQRNIPIGIVGSLAICTLLYMTVAAGAVGSPVDAQPIMDSVTGHALASGSSALFTRCADLASVGSEPLACSREALAHVVRELGHPNIGNLIGLAAMLALPSVILMMLYGQTRIFFVMSRDGLIPRRLAAVSEKTGVPIIITWVTGICVTIGAGFFPIGKLADTSNAGTLFAFTMVALSAMVLRRTQPERVRPFRTPFLWVIAPITMAGCIGLYLSLTPSAILALPLWSAVGLVIYFLYGRKHSRFHEHVG